MLLSIVDEEDWAYKLEISGLPDPITVKISSHFATRMAYEFLSWEWLLSMEKQRLLDFEQLNKEEVDT
jgi:hypothetical protein